MTASTPSSAGAGTAGSSPGRWVGGQGCQIQKSSQITAGSPGTPLAKAHAIPVTMVRSQVSGEKVGECELGAGNYVNALAMEERSKVVFAGGKDGILVKIQF